MYKLGMLIQHSQNKKLECIRCIFWRAFFFHSKARLREKWLRKNKK